MYLSGNCGSRPRISIASPPPRPAIAEPSPNVRLNTRSTSMPMPAAATRLSTAARTWAPKRVRSISNTKSERDHGHHCDQEQPIGAEIDAEHADLARQVRRQLHRLLAGAEEIGRRCHRHERKADGEQYLVELHALVQPAVEHAFEQCSDGAAHHERDRQRRKEWHAEARHRDHAQVAAQHREGAMRKVDEVHQAERDRQSYADDEQQRAIGDAVEQDANEVAEHAGRGRGVGGNVRPRRRPHAHRRARRRRAAATGRFRCGWPLARARSAGATAWPGPSGRVFVELDVVQAAVHALDLAHVDGLHDVARLRVDQDRSARTVDLHALHGRHELVGRRPSRWSSSVPGRSRSMPSKPATARKFGRILLPLTSA